ncbi:hypothetical protein BROUX41_004935 [Berkeleyomyces rouxiae]
MSSILSLSHSSIDLARAVVANHDPCTKQTTNKSAFGHHVSLGFRVEPSVYGLGTGGAIYSSVVMTLQCGADQIDRVDLCGFHNTNNGRRYEIQCMFPRLVMKYETGSSAMIVRVLSVEFRMELDFERMIRLIEGLNLRYKPFIAQKAPGTALRGSTVSPLTTAPMVHNFTPYRNVHTASPAPMSSTFRSQGLDLGGVGDRAFSPLQQEVSKGQPTSLTSYADMVYANKKDIKKPGTPKSLATESSASTEQTAAIDPSAVTADRIATETSTMQMDEDISKAQDNRSSDLLAKVLTGLFGSPSHMFAAIEKDAPWLLGKS